MLTDKEKFLRKFKHNAEILADLANSLLSEEINQDTECVLEDIISYSNTLIDMVSNLDE